MIASEFMACGGGPTANSTEAKHNIATVTPSPDEKPTLMKNPLMENPLMENPLMKNPLMNEKPTDGNPT